MNAQIPLKERLAELSTSPGVYLMKAENQKILYVGKAKNLRNRVRSYFNAQAQESPKTAYLVSLIHDIEVIVTGNELEALLLENNLIKKHKPKYNIRLRDDKTYPFIRLDLSHEYPRAYLSRRPKKQEGQLIYGPYTQAHAVYQALAMASKVFMLRDCRDHEFSNRSRACLSHQIGQCTAPCVGLVTKEKYDAQVEDFRKFLDGDTDALEIQWESQMSEASEAMNFEWAAKLRDRLQALRALNQEQQRIDSVEDDVDRDVWAVTPDISVDNFKDSPFLDLVILQFRNGKLLGREHYPLELEEKLWDETPLISLLVQYYAKKELPKEVLLPPGKLEISREDLQRLLSHEDDNSFSTTVTYADEKQEWAKLYDLALENAKLVAQEQKQKRESRRDSLKALKDFLGLKTEISRIECVDISNFQGAANVASCVVFENAEPKKDEYRHYNIQSFSGQDDFSSMREVVMRRFGKKGFVRPDLLVVDGGKGQLSSVCGALDELGVELNVIALAKARTKSDFRSSEVESSEERVFLPGQKNYKMIKNPGVLRLLSHVRDEAHRFAITFHRKKRDQST